MHGNPTPASPVPEHPFVPLQFQRRPIDESRERARQFYDEMNRRRTARQFSTEAVPRDLIEYGIRTDGTHRTHYYAQESCGITAGMCIAAIHHMGLVTPTHTPNPMAFLSQLLGRPANEKAMLVMPVGYPGPGARVPDLTRKPLAQIAVWR